MKKQNKKKTTKIHKKKTKYQWYQEQMIITTIHQKTKEQ